MPTPSYDDTTPQQPFAWRKLFQRSLILLGGIAIIWVLVFSGWLQVRGIEVRNSNAISNQDMTALFTSYTASNPTEKNLLFLNTDKLSSVIRARYPTVEKVNINRTLWLTLQVSVKEAEVALIWRTGTIDWVLGDDGRILKKNDATNKQLGSVKDTAQLSVKTGDQVVDRQFVKFVRDIYAQATNYGLSVVDTEIVNTTQELTLRLQNGQTIRCDTTQDAKEQLKAVQGTYDTAKRTGKPVTQYIDVRIPGRAFYK